MAQPAGWLFGRPAREAAASRDFIWGRDHAILAVMLVNGAHLLPDPSGALVWPARRLLVVADPLPEGDLRAQPVAAAEALKRLAAVLRSRQPRTLVWLGGALPEALAAGRLAPRDLGTLTGFARGLDWVWVAEALPEGLPGRAEAELCDAPLAFRHVARADGSTGEIAASPRPQALVREGEAVVSRPCYVFDGRRVVLPAFGLRAGGLDVLSPGFSGLFRRPFQVLVVSGGRFRTVARARLEAEAPRERAPAAPAGATAGTRMRLFPGGD